MNRLRLPVMLGVAALLGSGFAVAGEIYKWVDEDGNVHYEDRPVANSDLERVDIVSRNTDNTVVQAQIDADRKARAAARQVASEAPPEMSPEELRAEQQARHEKCQSYRSKLETFLTAPRMYKESEGGEREYLDEEQILAARSEVESKIEEYCGA